MDDLIRSIAGPDWATPWTLGAMLLPFLAGLIGILANMANRKMKGASIESLRDYFAGDLNQTVRMLTGYFIAYLVIAKLFYMNIVLGAMTGFMADNILRRYTPKGGNNG